MARIGVVTFPGSLDDRDAQRAVRLVGAEPVALWHGDHDLQNVDAIVLPGGFSYGDYLRSGAIARFSPIMQEVIAFANKGGFVFGVCNGFQILCEAGLVPGALLRNDHSRFNCENVYVRPEHQAARLTAATKPGQALKIPIAHGEGRYYTDAETLRSMEANGQILFRYCDASGQVTPEANPNGSLGNIAGVCNAGKNVFGMMPHPERAADPELGNTDGQVLFEGLLQLVSA